MKRFLVLMAAGLMASTAPAVDSSPAGVFQMRLVVDAASTNSELMNLSYASPNGTTRTEALHVQKKVSLDQTAVKSAREFMDKRYNVPVIEIILTDAGRKQFAELTRTHVGKRLAVIIGGRICCAPVIQSEIAEGKTWVMGSFDEQGAKEFAARINQAVAKK